MIAILVIIGVVGIVSLYDFLNTRNWQQVTSKVRNDAVFENRNREYGAYKIRKDYNRNFLLILLGLTGGIGVIYGAASTFREPYKKEKQKVVAELDTIQLDLQKDDLPEIPEIKIPEPPAQKTLVEIVEFNNMIASNTTAEKPPIPEPGQNIGTTGQTGEPGGFGEPGLPIGEPGGTGEDNDKDKDKIFSGAQLTEPAEFIGGSAARNLFLQKNLHFPEIAQEEHRGGKSFIKFVVRKDGAVDEVTLAKKNPNCPECDKEAVRVVRLMPDWKPGKIKGRPVDSYFNLPLTFTEQ